MDLDVVEWLASLKLEQYADAFLSNGYDHIDSIKALDVGDFDAIGITLPGHRKRLQLAAARIAEGEQTMAPASPSASSPTRQPPVPAPRRPGSVKRTPGAYENVPIIPESELAAPANGSVAPSRPLTAATDSSLPPAPTFDSDCANGAGPNTNDDTYCDTECLPPRPTATAPTATMPPALPARNQPMPSDVPPPLPRRNSGMKKTPETPRAFKGRTATVDATLDGPVIEIEDETMGVLRALVISKDTTAEEATQKFLEQYRPTVPDTIHDAVWVLLEAYVQPPVERPIPATAEVLPIKRTWPEAGSEYVPGCRFVLRAVPRLLAPGNTGSAVHAGLLDKRGGSKGNAKNWKRRYFRLADEGLSYYKSEPKSQKQAERPTGVWDIANSTVYVVRDELKVKSGQGVSIKKAKRPGLLFCLKPNAQPMWPDDAKAVLAVFDSECKFMCAANEEDRLTWVASIQQAQAISGEALEAVRKERAQTISSLPAAAPEDDVAAIEEEDDEEEDALPDPTSAADVDKSGAADPPASAIAPKKVRGIGLGDIFSEADFDLYGATTFHRHSVLSE